MCMCTHMHMHMPMTMSHVHVPVHMPVHVLSAHTEGWRLRAALPRPASRLQTYNVRRLLVELVLHLRGGVRYEVDAVERDREGDRASRAHKERGAHEELVAQHLGARRLAHQRAVGSLGGGGGGVAEGAALHAAERLEVDEAAARDGERRRAWTGEVGLHAGLREAASWAAWGCRLNRMGLVGDAAPAARPPDGERAEITGWS